MRSSINPLQIIFERLCNCGLTNDAFFLKDEVINWPPQIFDTLITYGLLQPTQPDTMLECDGCEESCIMPVTIYPAQNDKPGRAFIICDKRDDIGCVKVNLQRMEQWQVTNEQVANVLCKLLEFNQSAIQKIDNREWRIGTLLGKKRSIPVSLTHDDTLALSFAGHRVPLISILSIKDNILTIDKSALIRLANNPTTDIESESPKARRERLIASVKKEKAKGTKAFLRLVAEKEGISISRLKQLTSKTSDTESNSLNNTSLADTLFSANRTSWKK